MEIVHKLRFTNRTTAAEHRRRPQHLLLYAFSIIPGSVFVFVGFSSEKTEKGHFNNVNKLCVGLDRITKII